MSQIQPEQDRPRVLIEAMQRAGAHEINRAVRRASGDQPYPPDGRRGLA